MLNNVYFKPVEGVGSARTPKTEKERELEEQRKLDADRKARAEHVRKDYEQAERDRRIQEARGDRPYLVQSVAAIVGAGAVVSEIAETAVENEQLRELFERSARYNAIETPIVNQWASQSARLANNPYRDQQLLAAMIGPNGEQLFTDASQAQDFFRHQALFQAIYKHYGVDEAARTSFEQHLKTAREVVENLFPRDQTVVANTSINPVVNPTQAAQAQQARNVQAREAIDLRVSLHQSIANSALTSPFIKDAELADSLKQQKAQTVGAEIAAAFVREQALRDQILLDLKKEQIRVQEEIRETASKLEAAKQAETQRVALGEQGQRPAVNLDPSAQAALLEARKHDVELDPSGATKDPTKFEDGAYVDPNREQPEAELEEPVAKDQLAPIDARVSAFDEDGRPTDHHTKIDSLGADLGQAADQAGVRRGPVAAPVSTIERNGSVSRIDGLEGPRFGPVNQPGAN